MNVKERVILVLVLMTLAVHSISEAQVQVILQQPPPYQFKIEQMWKVTLVNLADSTLTVWLHARAVDAAEGLIVDGTSATFTLPRGIKIINPRELVPLSINEANPKYKDVVQNINGVPTGDYEICVSVINALDGQELGFDCMHTQVENLTRMELLEPQEGARLSRYGTSNAEDWSQSLLADFGGPASGEDKSTSRERDKIPPPVIYFSWLPPVPIPPGVRVTYALRIVELLGSQSPIDAMRSNPSFSYCPNIVTTIFQYPNAARSFDAGKQYAWKVDVCLNGVIVQESETRVFGVKDDGQARMKGDLSMGGRPKPPKASKDEKDRVKNRPLLLASLGFEPEYLLMRESPQTNERRGESALEFSGSARLNLSLADRIASFSEQPKDRWTAEVSPVLTVYGLPFTANVLLSSQQDATRQNINSFGFNFDLNRMRESLTLRLERKLEDAERSATSGASSLDPEESPGLRDPKNLADNLDQFGMISGGEKFFMSIRSLGFGTNYPSYSEYTLTGVPITGVNIELNPGIFYAAFTASANQRGIDSSAYRRSLYAGRLGLGQKEGTHLYFTGLSVNDDERSIQVDPANSTLTPKANQVFGTEARVNFFDGKLALEGEGAVSILTRDTRDPEFESKSIPRFLRTLVDQKISTSFDYSYSGKVAFNNGASGTRISAGVKMVGPGYTSLGAPNVRSDQFGFEGKVDQKLLSRHVSVGASYKQHRDNLISWKRSTTTTTAYGANLGFNFPSLPFLKLSFAPYFQTNDDLSPLRKVDNQTTVYSAVSGYSFPLGKLRSTSSFVFTGQRTVSIGGLADCRANSYMFTEGVSFTFPLTMTTSLGLVQSFSGIGYGRINTADISATTSPVDEVSVGMGMNLAIEKGRNKKTGFYLSSIVSLSQMVSMDVRAERNVYAEDLVVSGDYQEFIFAATLTVRW